MTFSVVLICQLIIPQNLFFEVDDLVELTDDTESEEDNEEESDELEWRWQLEQLHQSTEYAIAIVELIHNRHYVRNLSDGASATFCPPPENKI
ncbi:hypothetical protein [Parvicella tangerina]|uniref:Uncharacterized protein n=1 Tax=Parvicella tangerina TaxID=2829795 RepID=A0A916JJW9_9FLAO|nr:hypothetical protein [Parvicella tangerina]CAG5078056.1 hypothetical protein CRYO30217_00558 [Parvicella tangerina]